jgi:hypothetical protein
MKVQGDNHVLNRASDRCVDPVHLGDHRYPESTPLQSNGCGLGVLGRVIAYWTIGVALSGCAIVMGACEVRQERLACTEGTMVLLIPSVTIRALGDAAVMVREANPWWLPERPNEGP